MFKRQPTNLQANVMAFCALILAIASFLNSFFPITTTVFGAPLAQNGPSSVANKNPSDPNQSTQIQAAAVNAVINRTFNYQGVLRKPDGKLVPDGKYTMTFNIYENDSGGSALHTEQKTNVPIRDGIFNVVLGNDVGIGSNVFANMPRYLGIAVDPDPEMSPRQQIHPVPWSLTANTLVPDAEIAGGITLRDSTWNGLQALNPVASGLYVENAGMDGVYMNAPKEDGVQINNAGRVAVLVAGSGSRGIEVQNTGSDGFAAFSPQGNGLRVNNATENGVLINGTGSGWDGIYVDGAGLHGIEVVNAADYAGVFRGRVWINGICQGCTAAVFGQNVSNIALVLGDLVTIRGVKQVDFQEQPILEISRANSQDAVLGVVYGRAELKQVIRENENSTLLVSRSGVTQPGEYISIITSGLAQVKVNPTGIPIKAGALLTVSDEPGRVRTLDSTAQISSFSGTPSVIGTALQNSDTTQSLIWVLVNPR